MFGITSTAFAHRGDNGFFHLGHKNVKHAVSKLVGRVAGPSLVIGNGSEDRRATALRLNVKPGKAPMQVSSDTKVRKLNADKLDGKDASAIGVNGRERVSSHSNRDSTAHKHVVAYCPDGKTLIGGGASVHPWLYPSHGSDQPIVIRGSWPEGDAWVAMADEIAAYNLNWSLHAYAICANAP